MPETHIGRYSWTKGYCEITYHPLTSTGNEYVSFYWTGGTDNGNNPTLTPVPTQPIFPTETPTPTIPDNTITDVDSVVNKWEVIIGQANLHLEQEQQ